MFPVEIKEQHVVNFQTKTFLVANLSYKRKSVSNLGFHAKFVVKSVIWQSK